MIEHYISRLWRLPTTNQKNSQPSAAFGILGYECANPAQYVSRRKIADTIPNTIDPEQLRCRKMPWFCKGHVRTLDYNGHSPWKSRDKMGRHKPGQRTIIIHGRDEGRAFQTGKEMFELRAMPTRQNPKRPFPYLSV